MSFQIALEFDADGEFVRGFEAGRLWTQLQDGDEAVIGQPIHASNAEMVLRMGEALGLSITAGTVDDTWIVISEVEALCESS